MALPSALYRKLENSAQIAVELLETIAAHPFPRTIDNKMHLDRNSTATNQRISEF